MSRGPITSDPFGWKPLASSTSIVFGLAARAIGFASFAGFCVTTSPGEWPADA